MVLLTDTLIANLCRSPGPQTQQTMNAFHQKPAAQNIEEDKRKYNMKLTIYSHMVLKYGGIHVSYHEQP